MTLTAARLAVQVRTGMQAVLLAALASPVLAQPSLATIDCAGRAGFTHDPDQCDKYHECRDGRLTTHLCPDGLVYDKSDFTADFQLDSAGVTGKCSYQFSIDCRGRERLQAAQPSPGCPRANGFFPHTDCDK